MRVLFQENRNAMKKIILVLTMFVVILSASAQDNNINTQNWSNSNFITEQNLPELKIYPNPCKEQKVTLELKNQEFMEIKITNITGKEIYFNRTDIPESKKQIQLNNFPNGMYLVQIKTTDNKIVAKKLLVASN